SSKPQTKKVKQMSEALETPAIVAGEAGEASVAAPAGEATVAGSAGEASVAGSDGAASVAGSGEASTPAGEKPASVLTGGEDALAPTPESYEFTLPEGFTEDEDLNTEARKAFADAGVP